MMGLWKSLAGTVTVEILSASPTDMLTAVNECGITLFDVTSIDELRVRASLYRFDVKILRNCLAHRNEDLTVISRNGIIWAIQRLLHRKVLLVGLLLFTIMALYLPTRVLFVRVEGNREIPTQMILENAEQCGIGFGASRRQVRSEKMKNALLAVIPDLQWAGVNTYGCVAVISVRERSVADKEEPTSHVTSIIAARDGIIQELTVLQGNPVCRVGQAVREGQLLVSGYTDCGILIKTTRSDAEVIAQTQHDLDAVTLSNCLVRGEITAEVRRYTLRIGKNLINFSKDSGISDTTCVKIYDEKHLTLPGGYTLPVTLITERLIYTEAMNEIEFQADAFAWMAESADSYLYSQMLAGKILDSARSDQTEDGIYKLSSHYSCVEMIGKVRNEEIVEKNGKGN